MATIITAVCVPGFIALAAGLLMYVHNRDQKADAAKNKKSLIDSFNI